MLFANEQMTSQMGALLEEGRQYWNLQKKYLGLHTAEVLTRLLSRIALVLILILVGSLVLLFGSFALAFWLGALLDSTTLGFCIIAGLLLLLRCTEELGQKSALLLLRLSAEHAEQSAHIIAVLLLRVIGRCGKAAQKCRCDQAEEALYLVLLYAGLLG